MAYRTLAANDISARQVDAGIKNKFKWCWLEESETLPGGKSVKFDECFRKISLSGKVLRVFCNDTINYASSGKKALHSHVRLSKHVSAYTLQSQNMKLVIPQSSSTVTITSDSTNQFVPMCDRIANNQAMVLAVMAENSLPMTMAPVLIDLAKQLARDPKALGSLSKDRTSASYKMTHGVHKTMQDRTVQAMRNVPFCLNIDECTSNSNKRVLGVLASYFSNRKGG